MAIPETPPSNLSFKSDSDASFLQKEIEIDIEQRTDAIYEEPTLERIAEVSPPVSTPFKDYRSVEDFFNNTDADHSVQYEDNTIMSFDNISISKLNSISHNKQNTGEEST